MQVLTKKCKKKFHSTPSKPTQTKKVNNKSSFPCKLYFFLTLLSIGPLILRMEQLKNSFCFYFFSHLSIPVHVIRNVRVFPIITGCWDEKHFFGPRLTISMLDQCIPINQNHKVKRPPPTPQYRSEIQKSFLIHDQCHSSKSDLCFSRKTTFLL